MVRTRKALRNLLVLAAADSAKYFLYCGWECPKAFKRTSASMELAKNPGLFGLVGSAGGFLAQSVLFRANALQAAAIVCCC